MLSKRPYFSGFLIILKRKPESLDVISSFLLRVEFREILNARHFVQQLSEQSLFAMGLGTAVAFFFCLSVHLSPSGRLTNNHHSFLGPQKIHTDPTPRIGGLGLIIAMFVQALFLPDEASQLVLIILVAVLPVFLSGFAEDVTNSVSPRVRLLTSFIAGVVFVG